MLLARIRHQLPAADADALALRGRAPSSRFDVLSSTPASSSGPRDQAGPRLDALTTKVGDGCGQAIARRASSRKLKRRAGRAVWFAAVIAAMCSFLFEQDRALERRVPHCVAEQTRGLVARIRSADNASGGRLRLVVEVTGDEQPHCIDLTGRTLRLNWHRPPAVQPGETWRLAAEVRVPWGFRNPGGFDYERWLMANGVHGTGYVRRGERLGPADPALLERVHRAIAEQVQRFRNRPHLLALATGDGSHLGDEHWSLLRRTGTVHLLVVSGLHVGLVAVFGLVVGRGIGRLVPAWLARMPLGRVAALVSLGAVVGFVWLSGAGIPAVRAGVMAGCGVLAFAAGRAAASVRWLALAAIAVLIVQPLAPLSTGFWLSFGAVALLLAGLSNRVPAYGWLPGLARAQFLMMLGMTPLVAFFAGEAAPVAALANLYAVPWVSVVVVPLVLTALAASVLLPPLAELCWTGADAALSSLLGYLQWLDGAGVRRLPIGLEQLAASLLALGCLVRTGNWRGILACLPLYAAGLVVLEQRPPHGEVRVLSLDVGQGSAILIDTSRHRLLYDAGARYASGFDLGEAVVLPAIAATGRQRLDRVIVSHGDTDHAGGARAVLDGVPVESLVADVPGLGGRPCIRGERWTWDGVHFAILHPPESFGQTGNDASCVLAVTARSGRALLPGDIERRAERLLGAQGLEPVDLLFAPHHGSNTSSTGRFVAALSPRIAVMMAGFGNRYGHPHPAVVSRYRQAGADVRITGRDGALTWRSDTPGRIESLRRQRGFPWHWWINAPPRAKPAPGSGSE